MNTIERIHNAAKHDALIFLRSRRWSTYINSVVLPAAFALWAANYGEISGYSSNLFWSVVIGIIIVQAFFVWNSIDGITPIQSLYFDAVDLAKEDENLRTEASKKDNRIIYLSAVQNAAVVWRVMQREYVAKKLGSKNEIINVFNEIMSPITGEMTGFFDLAYDELWDLAIFIFNPGKNRLEAVWRKKSANHPSGATARDWAPGQGHVGVAFAQRETKITGDATDAEVSALLRAPREQMHEYDSRVYRSFVSAPIGPLPGKDEPVGVLVITSNQRQRFDKANAIIIRHAAGELANFLHLNHIDSKVLFDETQPSEAEKQNG